MAKKKPECLGCRFPDLHHCPEPEDEVAHATRDCWNPVRMAHVSAVEREQAVVAEKLEAIEKAVETERATIVAYLRRKGRESLDYSVVKVLSSFADHIEDRQHLEKENDG